jgi:leader peptidase (prepilin peptidase)/N-methyltransferase
MAPSQQLVLFVFSGLFGLTIGSFLNVCIFRLPRNCMSIVKPRSRCPRCLNWIAWYDNLPVLSWMALGGKCRHCRNPISVRYALVELLTGALFLYAGWRAIYASPLLSPANQAARFAVDAWFISAMVICTFVDLDFRIIPDEVSLSGILIGLAASAAFPFLHPGGLSDLPVLGDAVPKGLRVGHFAALAASAVGAVVGAGTIYVVGVMGKILFRKRVEAAGEDTAMGLGDVKFMAMAGAVLGWRGVLCTLMLACLCGAIFGVGKLLVTRRMGFVPFGPFLATGALTVLFIPGGVNAALGAYMSLNQCVVKWLTER